MRRHGLNVEHDDKKGEWQMKKIVLMGIVALATASAMAQGNSEDNIPPEVAEKIPEECRWAVEKYRWAVLSEIRTKADRQAKDEMERKFGIVWNDYDSRDVTGWTNSCGKSVLCFAGGMHGKYDKDGRLVKVGKGLDDFEEWRWREARQKEIQETLWKDQAVVDVAISNAVANLRHSRQRERKRSCLDPLEELIPLEEAMALAKAGKGKGYFQLALRYANGQELPCDARKAYMLLCKAGDVNYANAILVQGLCEEESLKAEVWGQGLNGRRDSLFKGDGSSVLSILDEYCGNDGWLFVRGNPNQKANSLTNEVAVAQVMGKYEKAKALGALTATNQIAALNKRLADFRVWLAVYNAKKEADEKKAAQWRTAWEKERSDNRMVHATLGAKEQARYRVAFEKMFGYEMGEKIACEAGEGRWRARKLRGSNAPHQGMDEEIEGRGKSEEGRVKSEE